MAALGKVRELADEQLAKVSDSHQDKLKGVGLQGLIAAGVVALIVAVEKFGIEGPVPALSLGGLLALGLAVWLIVTVCRAIRARELRLTRAAYDKGSDRMLAKARRLWGIELVWLGLSAILTPIAIQSAGLSGGAIWLPAVALIVYVFWQFSDYRDKTIHGRYWDEVVEGADSWDEPGEELESTPEKTSAPVQGEAKSKPVEVKDEPVEELEDVLAELNTLIGLGGVKAQVSTLINNLTVQQRRSENQLKQLSLGGHLVFTGPPGVGKTTVAELLARIYRSLGFLERGHIVRATRADLVGGYIGHTAQKVDEICARALGGVLFIDEAYSLAGSQSEDFGHEAIAQLLLWLENQRSKFVCIIAGYENEMRELLESNPGLKSRFDETIHFDAYTPEELFAISRLRLADSEYRVSADAEATLLREIQTLHADLGNARAWSNGREMRRLVEAAISAHANRYVASGETNSVSLDELDPADISAAALKVREHYEDAPAPKPTLHLPHTR